MERAQARKFAVADLVEAHRLGQILQTMLAEVVERPVLQELAGGVRDDDLAAVPCSADPGGAVDVDAYVPLFRGNRRSRMEAHAHADRPAGERLLSARSRRDSADRRRECVEEGVALGVDLDTVVSGERVSQGAPVVGEDRGIAVAMLLDQPRRALDVGEEQRDRARR